LLLLFQLKRFMQIPFFISWWAFLFPSAAMTIDTVEMYLDHGKVLYHGMFILQVVGLLALAIFLSWKTIELAINRQLCVKEYILFMDKKCRARQFYTFTLYRLLLVLYVPFFGAFLLLDEVPLPFLSEILLGQVLVVVLHVFDPSHICDIPSLLNHQNMLQLKPGVTEKSSLQQQAPLIHNKV